jgi:hypothetical protein
MSGDKDFEKWWKSLPHQLISEQSFRNYAENGYKAGKRKGEEERDELAEKNETLTKLVDSDTSYILKIGDELAKERAVVDYYADKDVWESGEVEHYKDVVDIHDCNFLDVGKIYTDAIRYGGKRARARQKERSEG